MPIGHSAPWRTAGQSALTRSSVCALLRKDEQRETDSDNEKPEEALEAASAVAAGCREARCLYQDFRSLG
jgi:hypothetical protein